jgi:hypothetical protein
MDYELLADVLHKLFFIFQGILFYLTLTLFLHCFYDDTIKLQKLNRKSVFKILLMPVLFLPVSAIIMFFIGFTDGNVARGLRITLELSANDCFNQDSFTTYILTLMLIPGIKRKDFRQTARRFFTVLLFLITIATAVHLTAEMLRYCFTATGLYRAADTESDTWSMIIQQCMICLLLGMLLLIICFRIYKKGIALPLRKADSISLLLYYVIESMISLLFKSIEQKEIALAGDRIQLRIIIVAAMMLLLTVIPVLIIRNRISVSYQEQNAYQAQFLEAELQASRQYKAAQEDTRAFRHDVQNNLTVIAMMMQEGKIEDAQHYLNDLRSEISALSPKVVTEDEMVDALISAKLVRISECGITFRMDGVIDSGLNWKPMDICTVFANLLDNAIEAAANTENGFIDLEFKNRSIIV